MDPYTTERLLIDRMRAVEKNAERRARLMPLASLPVRAWAAGRLRLLADRLEAGQLARSQKPTA